MSKRVNVKVLVDFGLDGNMLPVRITWPDGREFEVDRVMDVRPAPAKSGGTGLRFTCRIRGREVPLYFGADKTGKVIAWWCDGRE
jgi:hypothetical protein